MRASRGIIGSLLLLAPLAARAQSAEAAALKHGRIVVWVVHPATGQPSLPSQVGNPAARPPGYNEQTAGSFGQESSEFGTTAGSVGVPTTSPSIARTGAVPADVAPADRDAAAAAAAGYREQTSGSFGQTSGSFGTPSSNHGQTASTLGQTSSNVGTVSSNYGQTASSYGQTASSFGETGQPVVRPTPTNVQDIVGQKLRTIYPALSLQFVTVAADKLQANLKALSAAGATPDVVVFEGFPATWRGPPQALFRQSVDSLGGGSGSASPLAGDHAARLVLVLAHGRNRPAAQAFAEYLQDEGLLKVPVPSH